MSYQTPVTIRHMIQGIQAAQYVLPAIQREFVWGAPQIERLFDSLMRGYPIGSFLFWKVEAKNVANFQFYRVMDRYHQRDHRHNPVINLAGQNGVTAILDGQQRLTALNIGLRGTYATKLPYYRWDTDAAFPERKLYLNLLSKPDADRDLAYEFRMLRQKDAADRDGKYWYPVGEVLKLNSVDAAFYYCVEAGLAQQGDHTASSNLINLWRIVHDRAVINYYLEEAQDLDKVLNIFIRVNSAGTELSYSDMLLSIATAVWKEKDARKEINDLVDSLNRTGEGFQLGRDFVLKACLVLTDLPSVAFKVVNFTRDNMLLIEREWDRIARALQLAVSLLASWGYSSQTLTSNNAVIPIAYYLSKLGCPDGFVGSEHYRQERVTIQRWLAVALLKRVFSGQSDTTLTTMRRVLSGEHASFPATAIEDALTHTRPMYFAKPELEGLLAYRYGQSYTFIVLSMLFPWLRYDQHFHVDHIHPRALFTEKKLAALGIPEARWHEWLDHVNDLGNLQLLQGLPNTEKAAKPFATWLQETTTDEASRAHYRSLHLIPDVDPAFENFPTFLAEREKLILKQLGNLLQVDLDAPAPDDVPEEPSAD